MGHHVSEENKKSPLLARTDMHAHARTHARTHTHTNRDTNRVTNQPTHLLGTNALFHAAAGLLQKGRDELSAVPAFFFVTRGRAHCSHGHEITQHLNHQMRKPNKKPTAFERQQPHCLRE